MVDFGHFGKSNGQRRMMAEDLMGWELGVWKSIAGGEKFGVGAYVEGVAGLCAAK